MSRPEPLRPVVLIGAARSGTKITRDALSMAVGVPAVPTTSATCGGTETTGIQTTGCSPRTCAQRLVDSLLRFSAGTRGPTGL